MKVILKEEVINLGKAGDIVSVKNGFGRNYLIPKDKAIIVKESAIRDLEHKKRIIHSKLLKEKKQAEIVAKQIENHSCTIARAKGEDDKIFGSVTSKDIEESLAEEGYKIDRKQILLDKPIKNLGVFYVDIKLHSDISTKLKVWVVEK
jgi:large subunit ribosomal protein L9